MKHERGLRRERERESERFRERGRERSCVAQMVARAESRITSTRTEGTDNSSVQRESFGTKARAYGKGNGP